MIPKHVRETFDRCVTGFFKDNSAAATVSEVAGIQVSSHACVVATIGFTSDLAKGAVIVIGRPEDLKKIHPLSAMGADISETDIFDWCGEIANQVLGRFKNAMLRAGLTLNMSVPSIVRGSDLKLTEGHKDERIFRAARMNDGATLGFALLLSFAKGYDPTVLDEAPPDAGTAKEGDGFLF